MDMTELAAQSGGSASAPKIPVGGENYVKNLCALWESDPKLALALEAVSEEDVPRVEAAREGGWTTKVETQSSELKVKSSELKAESSELKAKSSGASRGVYLHSRYRPVAEGRAWAEAVGCEDRHAVVVSGFGLGYHVKALWERLGGADGDAVIVVAEANLGVLKAALRCEDYSEMLRGYGVGGNMGGVVMIVTSLDRGQLVERLEPRSVMFTAGAGTLLTSHAASVQLGEGFYAAFQKLVTEFIAFTRTGFITLMLNNVATCRNIANNLGRYATTPPLDVLRDAFKGMPAVLVAAGPSLAKNMHLLHEVVGNEERRTLNEERGTMKGGAGVQRSAFNVQRSRKAVIIAVQTMLKPLLAAGIEPDFVTSLDYNTVSTRFFENLEESAGGKEVRTHLVAEAKANWNVLDVFNGTMSLAANEFAAKLLRGAGGGVGETRAGLKAGATVAHLSFYLAEFLGCDPIILVGQDLGFVDGLYYKPGTAIHETWGVELGRFNTLETKEWERIVRSRTILRKIPDIHGHPMYTEEQFFVYLQQFERDFAASRCRVIDATEGGARKQGVEVMTLRQAIDEGLGVRGKGLEGERLWKNWKCDVVGNLKAVREALLKRRAEGVGMKETCEETMPLLEEMLTHQEDAERMNRLFVEVDRRRSRVGASPETFEMVCYLNTIGELRRFQADLGVKGVKGDTLDRQRRQLLRDKEYVANLKVGAERLIEIVEEALGRVERQIAAAESGRTWPREVAGA
jgi:hypothetical protein